MTFLRLKDKRKGLRSVYVRACKLGLNWNVEGALLAVVRLCILLLPSGKLKHNNTLTMFSKDMHPIPNCQSACISYEVQGCDGIHNCKYFKIFIFEKGVGGKNILKYLFSKGCDGIHMLQPIPLLVAQRKLQVLLLNLNWFNVFSQIFTQILIGPNYGNGIWKRVTNAIDHLNTNGVEEI